MKENIQKASKLDSAGYVKDEEFLTKKERQMRDAGRQEFIVKDPKQIVPMVFPESLNPKPFRHNMKEYEDVLDRFKNHT